MSSVISTSAARRYFDHAIAAMSTDIAAARSLFRESVANCKAAGF